MKAENVSRRSKGWILSIVAQALWGSSSVVISLISKSLPDTLLVGVRHTIGSVFLYINLRGHLRSTFKNLPWRHLIILGLLAGSLPDLLLVESVRKSGPIVAVLLARLEMPLGVLFAHLFLKEKVNRTAYLASLIGLVGAGFIAYQPGDAINIHTSFYLGVLCGIAAGISWGLSAVYVKFILSKGSDSTATAFIRLALGAATSLVLVLFFVHDPLSILKGLYWKDWLKILYLGVFASGAAYMLYNKSLKVIDAHVAQILVGVSMIVSVCLGLAIGVRVSMLQWLGIATIVFSIYMIKARPSTEETLD